MDTCDGNYKYEIPCYDTPKYVEPNTNDKYKFITNVSQLHNRCIKQPKSNEFIIKLDNMICPGCIFFFSDLFFSYL